MDSMTSWGSLPAEVGIYTAAELRTQWLARLAEPQDSEHVELDGSAVEQFDAAGAQGLLALARTLGARGQALHLTRASATLADGCRVLGLSALLGVQEMAA